MLVFLLPFFLGRSVILGVDRRGLRQLWSRWRLYLGQGLDELRKATWPGIRYERIADIWFHVALMELFSVLNVTRRPERKSHSEERILVVKLAHFGDALHVFPMVREIRRQRPAAIIDMLVGPWCEGLARHYGLNDNVLVHFPRLGLFDRGLRSTRRSIWAEVRWLMYLRRRRYDLILSTSTTTLSELVLMHALQPCKWVGTCVEEWLHPSGDDAILIRYDYCMYESKRVMGLLGLVALNEGPADLFYPLDPRACDAGRSLLEKAGLPLHAAYAILCPGAGWPGKQWVPDRFAEIGDRLWREKGLHVVITGSAEEQGLCDEVARHMKTPVINIAGKTTIGQLAGVISQSALFVGNDSGPMHLAACFRVPSVLLFGPTVASKWAPVHPAARCLQHEDCQGCVSWHFRATCVHENRCMKAVSTEEVWSSVMDVLEASASKGA